MWATIRRRLVWGLLVAAAALLAAEAACRLLFGEPVVTFVGHMPDGSEGLFDDLGDDLDPVYQEPFDHNPVPKDPMAGRHRVFFLGGSSVHGGAGRVPRHLEFATRVAEAMPGLEVHNLGAAALDSGHLLALARETLPLRPEAVVVYTGHNDLANAAFLQRFSSPRALGTARARALLGHSRLFQLLDAAVRGREVARIYSPAEAQRTALSAAQRETVHQVFAEQLASLVRLYQGAGVKVVLATVASNPAAPQGDRSCRPKIRGYGQQSNDLVGEPLDRVSLDEVTAQLAQQPDCRELRWVWARLAADHDPTRRAEALTVLDELRDSSPNALRADRATVAVIREVAARYDVPLADVNAVFREQGGGVEPQQWFVDVVHLSAAGHAAVAAIVAPLLARELGVDDPGLALPRITTLALSGCVAYDCDRTRAREVP